MSSNARPWPYARIIAHRGGGTRAPENTLAAIRTGMQHGFAAIEIDAMLAADQVPVLIHDDTLERTAGTIGRVAECDAADLARLDAGSWFGAAFAGESIPSLTAAIALCRRHQVWMNVEIKPSPGAEVQTGSVVAITVREQYADLVRADGATAAGVVADVPLLSSFSRAALRAARQAAPQLPRGYLVERLPDGWREQLEALGCVSLHLNHRYLTFEQADAIKDAGYWLFCYTVNEPARARELLSWGVDALCTDRIDLIGAGFAAEA